QLRGARAVSDARGDGRAFAGLCVDPPNGFRGADTLAVYGGLEALERTCGICSANALKERGGLAGCIGLLPLWPESREFHAAIDQAIEAAGMVCRYSQLFPQTEPRSYGLWIESPVGSQQQVFMVDLIRRIEAGLKMPELHELERGLAAALEA